MWRAWAVWFVLALALPLAQVGAFAHGLSHLDTDGASKHAVHGQACDQCVASAGVIGTAPTSAPPSPFQSGLGHAAPAIAGRPAQAKAPALAYHSRAPPVILR